MPDTVKPQPMLEGPDVKLWQTVSEQTQIARHQQTATALNETLLSTARQRQDALGSAFTLWAAESLMLENRYDEAIAHLRELGFNQAGREFLEVPIAPAALENLAVCHERNDQIDEAIDTYDLLASKHPQLGAWAYYKAGKAAEYAGRPDDARKAYAQATQAKDEPRQNSWPMQELAKRASARLDSKSPDRFPQLEGLVRQVGRLLRSRDVDALRDLASPTHFTLGVAGAHLDFVDPAIVMTHLQDDLRTSTPLVNTSAIKGSGEKRYLQSDGWRGSWFSGRVVFLLTQCATGWEWSGVIFFQLPQELVQAMDPPEKRTNQPLSIPIKAPWPRGEQFTAGGLLNFIHDQDLAFIIPFYFPFVSWRDCGFGPGGFYYNFGTTHVGINAFAIDFTQYQRGVPYLNTAGFHPVLACFAGVVTLARGTVISGDADLDNRVEIRHTLVDFSSRLPALIRTPYLSKSLHLAGPDMVPVSRTMFVRQGARLGMIDDTGTSVMNHLHFSIHDDNMSGMSVAPSPMDLQTLEDGDRGRCVSSTNVPFP